MPEYATRWHNVASTTTSQPYPPSAASEITFSVVLVRVDLAELGISSTEWRSLSFGNSTSTGSSSALDEVLPKSSTRSFMVLNGLLCSTCHITLRCPKSPATRLFGQQLVQANNNKTSNVRVTGIM